MTIFKQSRELLDMIKFEHTVFALPFALLGAVGAAQGLPPLRTALWILAAMVGARTAAMTFNRLVDVDVDAANPRTASRALPAGRVSQAGAVVLMGAGIVLFGLAAGALGPLTWSLSPLALVIILGYSLCKRFTAWAHVVLGLSLSGAPLGAWIAVAGRIEPPALWLSGGVLAWTAGFDILYALQDEAFDRERGLHSIPSKLGVTGSLWLSRSLHVIALACWGVFNLQMGGHLWSWAGWALVAAMLGREQWLVRGGDLSRIDQAFFTLNSLVGLVFFAGHALEYWLSKTLLAPL
ncbi:UbiA-like polyprenyltransferase [Geothrix sp. PMB-07]|uniref:UbiA-like polyprenyltransferase n=1 Tax=Geothrix sp. PMB-07 TaxID=3068640 RepID=UPI002741BCB9|nr:UbiA-like polyprenyltransferase [Geothrix sp. PMB-07]WLT33338.1 UbiA-like polyprenyltransferase [Geothrix sp. PMB-07]